MIAVCILLAISLALWLVSLTAAMAAGESMNDTHGFFMLVLGALALVAAFAAGALS